jgi:3-hydroxyanthranilate 3,4-dioxygenase
MHRDHRLKENAMRELKPFNFREWIDKNRPLLKPPVCNKLVFEDAEFIVMVVGGPNNRKDYHYDEGEEFFYQLEGDMVLKIMGDGRPKDIRIREGDIFLLPPRIPHSPQRFADTVGLVIERKRHPEEKDGLLWYCDNCANLLYEEYFHLRNVETDFPPVFERFYAKLENRTCKQCGTVTETPK